MTINEIFNGRQGGFPGLMNLLHLYLDTAPIQAAERTSLNRYLSIISKRASGELDTTATYIRNFVRQHPAYKHNSVVPPQINFDLLNHLAAIMAGKESAPRLLGTL